MLRSASVRLASISDYVTVIGRNSHRLAAMTAACSNIIGISVDYHNTEAFIEKLKQSRSKYGPSDLGVCWIHETAPDAAIHFAAQVGTPETPARFIQVLGSAAMKPTADDVARRDAIARMKNINYCEVLLGCVHEGTSFRWLTHQEISDGVIDAINLDVTRLVVGDNPTSSL